MNRSHRIRLDPTQKDRVYFAKACGVARFTWNWALARWEELYQTGATPSGFALKKEFNAKKKEEFPWVYEVTKYASQQPFIYLQRAYQAFFKKTAERPKFKKKGTHDSFYIGGDLLQVEGKRAKIPNLGWVRMREAIRFEGKINSATISCKAGHWYISFSVETSCKPIACENQAVIGVDLGINKLAQLSNGESFLSPRPYQKKLRKLKRLQRLVSRRTKGSRNREKAKHALAKMHDTIGCIRGDVLHKLTTYLTENFRHIVIEDLDVSKMLQDRRLSRHIMDMGWYEFRRQLAYKIELRRNRLYIADRWYASSKTCSSCGNVKDALSLSERTYECPHCDMVLDRDLNAAKCLELLFHTVSSTGMYACGQDGSVIHLKKCIATSLAETGTKHCTDLYRF